MVEWANKYVGIPYVLHSRSMDKCDCYGLLWLIYKNEYNIDLPVFDDQYCKDTSKIDILKIFKDNLERWKEVFIPKIGDAIYFRIAGLEKHVGIMVSDNSFIHNFSKGGSSTICDINNPKWRNRIVGFYRYE